MDRIVVIRLGEELRKASGALSEAATALERIADLLGDLSGEGVGKVGAPVPALAPVLAPAPSSAGRTDAPVVAPAPSSAARSDAPIVSPAPSPAVRTDAPVVAPAPSAAARLDVPAETRPAAPPPRPAPVRAIPAPASIPYVGPPKDAIDTLADEIDEAMPYLSFLTRRQRTAQVASWAGRARAIQDPVRDRGEVLPGDRGDALRRVFGRLTRVTREMDCGWVDALSPDWSMDWEVYSTYHRAIAASSYPDLPLEREQEYHRAILSGLYLPQRRLSPNDAPTAILEAQQVLAPDDPDLAKAIERFGRPDNTSLRSLATRRTRRLMREDGRTADPKEEMRMATKRHVPDTVLAITRGKRALLAGGQGAREDHRLAILESLGLADLEWVTVEKKQAAPFHRLEERIQAGTYDIVFFLAAHSNHNSGAFVRACKDRGVPLVYLSRGYSVSTVVHEIQEQLLRPVNGA